MSQRDNRENDTTRSEHCVTIVTMHTELTTNAQIMKHAGERVRRTYARTRHTRINGNESSDTTNIYRDNTGPNEKRDMKNERRGPNEK